MSITITPDTVNGIYNSGQSDAAIQIKIDYVIDKIGQCLESNYGAAMGGLIAANYIAGTYYQTTQEISSERGSFGDSITYSTSDSSKNMYTIQARADDTAYCLNALIAKPFGYFATGQDA